MEITTGVWFGSLAMVLATIIGVVILWGGLRVGSVAVRADKDEAYKRLAEESVALQRRLLAAQDQTATALGELRERIAAVERMMREVA